MLPWLGEQIVEIFGPFRLLTSYLFLASLGTAAAAIATWYLLPRLWSFLNGRAYAVSAQQSLGKPVGAGAIFVLIFVVVCALVSSFEARFPGVLVGTPILVVLLLKIR